MSPILFGTVFGLIMIYMIANVFFYENGPSCCQSRESH